MLEHYYPYVLLAGTALWLAVAVRGGCRWPLWAPAPLAAAGVLYLLARADVLPPRAAGGGAAGAAGHRGRRRARAADLGALVLVVVLGLIALQGLDLKRIQLLDPPPLATIDVDVADGVKTAPAEARRSSS